MSLILSFFTLSLLSLITTILFYIYKIRKYYFSQVKVIIFGILLCTTLYLILNLPLFISFDFNSFIEKKEGTLFPILLFNLANVLYSASVILFLLTFLQNNKDIINLKLPSQIRNKKGNIAIGRILKGTAKKQKYYLSLKDLEKHIFICGSTGTGKTNFLQHFLLQFTKHYDIPFMLVEFKGEYHFLQKEIENLLIIRPGENFSLNIFNPEGAAPEVHAERIFDILKSGKFLDDAQEYSPQMEKVLVEILTKVCQNKKFQSWEGFYEYCKGYAKNKQKEIPMLSQTLISITNRIRRFSLGSLKAIFDTNNKLKVKELFRRKVLIDLSSIIRLGGEKEDALFFLNMVLKYLWDENLTRGAYKFKGVKHITIVEDTQYFAPKDITRQNKLTTYLEDIALLQRGTGECLISLATHPDISEEILANCGVLVCFKTHIEKEFLCKLLNLDIENEDYLSILEEGQCLIRVNSIKRPFLLHIPLIRRKSLDISEIEENNQKILSIIGKKYNSVSKFKKNDFPGQNRNNDIKNSHTFSNQFTKQDLYQNDVVGKQNQNNIQKEKDIKIKKNIPKSTYEVNDYNKLENFIKTLYKLQKKKEEF